MEGSSFLGQAVGQGGSGGVTPDADTSAAFQQGGTGQPVNVGITQASPAPLQQPAAPAPAQPKSRLQAILGAVANVVTTGLSGIPDRGRPSMVTGLGEGARASIAEQQRQQAFKMASFDQEVRLAQLHAQDAELALHTQAQTDAHQTAQDAQHDWDEAHGLQYDQIPNSADAVISHLQAQTQVNGAATVAPGTHLSADGKFILIPKATSQTQAAQLEKYSTFRAAYGLPSLPEGAQFVPSKHLDMLQNRIEGHQLNGNVYNHDDLANAIADLQANRDSVAKSAATSPDVLKQVDATIGSMKAKLDYLDNHKATILANNKQAELDVQNSPANQAAAASGAAIKKTAEEKAAFPYQMALSKAKAEQKNDSTELNAVAFDPNYQNADGTRGANVVMSKSDAQAKGLQHYKADASTINTVVGGFNDVQNKLNQLASVVMDPKQMGQCNQARLLP